MQEKIFKSYFTLKLANEVIQNKFNEEKDKAIKNLSKIYFYVLLFLSILGLILNTTADYGNENIHKQHLIIISSLCCTLLSALITILRTLYENRTLIKVLKYIAYVLLLFIMINLRFYMACKYMPTSIAFCAITAAEAFFRIFWKISFYLSFLEMLALNSLLCAISTAFHLFDDLGSSENALLFVYIFTHFKVTVLIYLLDKDERELFCLYKFTKIKNERLSSVLENMNTGYLSLKSGNIDYINNYLCKRLINVGAISSRIDQDINEIQNSNDFKMYFLNNSSFILKELFSNIDVNSGNSRLEEIALRMEFLTKQWKESDRNFILRFMDLVNIEICHGYIFLGDKTFSDNLNSDNFLRFEIYLKKINENELEILFNDVSRSRLIEQRSAEIKYRTLFLSKVVHEFKNPLLCINELIDQSLEYLSQITCPGEKHINEIFTQLKALSNYLLILVKDLDFFSQTQMNKSITLEKQQGSLLDTLEFINIITQQLLKKYGKQNLVTFQAIKDDYVPDIIYTDHSRLKQVLLNLISNSIKFTNTGYILLKIYLEKINGENYIKFIVEDTGIGLKEEQLRNIFNPYNKGRGINNENGAGLGLAIVRDLTELLGKRISLKSKEGEGSTFWFSILHDFPKSENGNHTRERHNLGGLINVLGNRCEHRAVPSDKKHISQNIELSIQTVTTDLSSLAENAFNVIIVDDEVITRQSMSRLITQVAKNFRTVVNIIQADDGIECLYIVYKSIRLGVKISLIFSDQSMHFLSGSESAEMIHKITRKAHINIPFYLVTAYEDKNMLNKFKTDFITDVITKPMNLNQMKLILGMYKNWL
jgi:signal transduction histidine kinase/CheY-like chemotaxis protein